MMDKDFLVTDIKSSNYDLINSDYLQSPLSQK